MASIKKIEKILESAKKVAIEYRKLTGKPLGITGEIGEFWVAKIFGFRLAEARAPGYDAIDRMGKFIQIKSRSIPKDKKITGQRLGSISFKHKWDVVVLVIMDEMFEPQSIYEADRKTINKALKKPGSKSRNDRGALSIAKFKSIGKQVWPR